MKRANFILVCFFLLCGLVACSGKNGESFEPFMDSSMPSETVVIDTTLLDSDMLVFENGVGEYNGKVYQYPTSTDAVPYRLFVDGKEIESSCEVYLYPSEYYADLPLIEIMEAKGAAVQWENNCIANIAYEEFSFVLDLSTYALDEPANRDAFNYLMPPPGTYPREDAKLVEGVFVVGHHVLDRFFERTDLAIEINFEAQEVYIS